MPQPIPFWFILKRVQEFKNRFYELFLSALQDHSVEFGEVDVNTPVTYVEDCLAVQAAQALPKRCRSRVILLCFL